ncbi:hypothetical protein [Flavimobilis soli]|nr:hypothetical protein [Flavimobilis soli]
MRSAGGASRPYEGRLEREMTTSTRTTITFATAAAILISSTGIAQAHDPNAAANEVAQSIATVAPEVGTLIDPTELGDKFRASSTHTRITIPTEGDGQIEVASADPSVPEIAVELPDLVRSSSGSQADDGTVVLESDDNASIAVQGIADGSFRLLSVLEGRSAEERYTYRFVGADLQSQEDGSVLVLGHGATIGAIEAPWARDADGREVPTRYEVSGDNLVQVIDHRSGDFTYPITADPYASIGIGVYIHFTRAETKTLANSVGGASGIGAFCTAWAIKLAKTPASAAAGAVLSGACLVGGLRLVYHAGKAENSSPKKCLYLRYIGVGTTVVPQYLHVGEYRDSRCK